MLRPLLIVSILCILGAYSQNSPTPLVSTPEGDSATDSSVASSDATTNTLDTSASTEVTSDITTSTKAPDTTTSTKAPDTTTSSKAPDTTTPVPVTTKPTPVPVTTKPTPTAEPTPKPQPTVLPPVVPNVTYEVVGLNNTVCIRLKAGIQLNITSKNLVYNMNPNTTKVAEGSTCNDTHDGQIMILEDEEYKLALYFAKDKKSAFVSNITLTVPEESFKGSGPYFSASLDNSYLCKAEPKVELSDNTTVLFDNLQLQAYMTNEKDFSKAEECAADNNKMNDIVPIIVACALVLMVVIILIGYLITRRQSRQRGYQSV